MTYLSLRDSKQTYHAAIACILGTLFASGCSVFGINNVEEAPYAVLQSEENYELREYAPIVVAQTTVDAEFEQAGSIAFNRLFDYISGNNKPGTKIAMTAPVMADPQNENGGDEIAMTAPVLGEERGTGWQYSFVLPTSYSADTAPVPTDERVELAELPRKKVAVLRYSGLQNAVKMRDKTQQLQQWIAANQMKPISQPRWAGYNPPWTIPFLRRNEVMIDVK